MKFEQFSNPNDKGKKNTRVVCWPRKIVWKREDCADNAIYRFQNGVIDGKSSEILTQLHKSGPRRWITATPW